MIRYNLVSSVLLISFLVFIAAGCASKPYSTWRPSEIPSSEVAVVANSKTCFVSFINDQSTKSAGLFPTVSRIYLKPGKYRIKIQYEGYSSYAWSKPTEYDIVAGEIYQPVCDRLYGGPFDKVRISLKRITPASDSKLREMWLGPGG